MDGEQTTANTSGQALIVAGAAQPRRMGRPPIPFDIGLSEIICERVVVAEVGLEQLLKPPVTEEEALAHGVAAGTILPSRTAIERWLRTNDNFRSAYACAKSLQADFLVDQTLEIADEDEGDAELCFDKDGKPFAKMNGRNVRRAEVMIKARQWAAGKLSPKRYGDKLDVTSAGEALAAPVLTPVMIDQRIQTLVHLASLRKGDEDEAQGLLE